MIINTKASSRRTRSTGSIRERVTAQLEQQRRDRAEACQHKFIRGKCIECGRAR